MSPPPPQRRGRSQGGVTTPTSAVKTGNEKSVVATAEEKVVPASRETGAKQLGETSAAKKSRDAKDLIAKRRQSLDTTSDYGGSESSRSVTPVASVSPIPKEEVEETAPPEKAGEEAVKADSSAPVQAEPAGAPPPLRRAVSSSQPREDDPEDEVSNDAAAVKAALESGLLSKDIAEEEARVAAKLEQKEKKWNWANRGEEDNISPQERYQRLATLLNQSKFYTDFLLKKMAEQEKAASLKAAKNKERAHRRESAVKQEEKENKADNKAKTASPRGGRGRQPAKSQPAQPLKRPASEEDERPEKKAKLHDSRSFGGRAIPSNQPLLLSGGIMRDYQLAGYEWMSSLWENGINGILADEMGLGKTLQVIALFCHLYEMGVHGPFLVVAPLSTIPNWLNEFTRFAPKVPCLLYHGSVKERTELRKKVTQTATCEEVSVPMLPVVITSFEIAMNDRPAFQNLKWRYIVVDEGHRLKNRNCRLIKELKLYQSYNRLLLTGTPLQNDMAELWSLLNFLLPEVFDDLRVFESWFDAKEIHEAAAESSERILKQEQQKHILHTLHQILTPFLLRRVKSDVDLEIPPKKEVLVYCPLTTRQKDMYKAVVEKTIAELLDTNKEEDLAPEDSGRGKRKKQEVDYSIFLDERLPANDEKLEEKMQKETEYLESIKRSSETSAYSKAMERLNRNEINFSIKSRMMDMRKAVNHPYLIDYPVMEDGMYFRIDEDLVNICGKLKILDQMLAELLRTGHKILIFSQMTRMLDILGDYLNLRNIIYSRLDGSMNYLDRQENIDRFNTDPSVQVFLLSTRAGGLGINLTAADTCIIYDSDWNPQQDLQAQDRCHRIGQTKPVMVYRLVTAGTIDQKIVERAAAKRKLEKMIIHKDKFKSTTTTEAVARSLQRVDPQELLDLLNSKDYVGAVECEEGQVLSRGDLLKLLDRTDVTWATSQQAGAAPPPPQELPGVFKVLAEADSTSNLPSLKL